MPGEVKDPTQGECVTCSGSLILNHLRTSLPKSLSMSSVLMLNFNADFMLIIIGVCQMLDLKDCGATEGILSILYYPIPGKAYLRS